MSEEKRVIQVEHCDGEIKELESYKSYSVFSQGIIVTYDNSTKVIPYVNVKEINFLGDEFES